MTNSSNLEDTSPENNFTDPKVDNKSKRNPFKRNGRTIILTESPYNAKLIDELKKQDTPSLKRQLSPSQTKKPETNRLLTKAVE